MNGDGTLSLFFLHPLVLFMGLVSVLKDVEKDAGDEGRRRSGRAGHLRHSCASGLVGLTAKWAPESYAHSKPHPHPASPP